MLIPPPTIILLDPLAAALSELRDVRAAAQVVPPLRRLSLRKSPAFMAPEQAGGELDKITARSDVFGLGATLCAMLIGKPPFEGDTAENVRLNAFRGRTDDAFARLDRCGADPELVALCKRCLAFEPIARPASGDEVAAAVASLRHAADDRAKTAEQDRLSAEVRRRSFQRAALAVALVLLLGIAGTSVGLWNAVVAQKDADNKRKTAEAETALANAVKTFLQEDVLELADPAKQQEQRTALNYDADVPLRDVVVRAAKKLDGKFPERPLVEADIRHTLGYALFGMGRADLAVGQLDRAAALRRDELGRDHPQTLDSVNNLANCYGELGRYREALELHQANLLARRTKLGSDHQDTMDSMSNSAAILVRLNRYPEAKKLLEESASLRREKLGRDHPETLLAMNNLAICIGAMNSQGDVLSIREETLRLQKEKLGADHPHTLLSMNNVAATYHDVGRHADALRLREETFRLQKAKLGPRHPHTLLSMGNLAESYYAVGRQVDAVELQEKTLALFTDCLGPEHPQTSNTAAVLISMLQTLKPPAESLSRIDALVAASDLAVAAGKKIQPKLINSLFSLRIGIQHDLKDAVGCRATADRWDKRTPLAPAALYNAACFHAVAAGVQAESKGDVSHRLAGADADKAMTWLQKAVSAGYKDLANMKKDADLDYLRNREDFKKLMASLEESAPDPTPPKK